MTPTPKRTRRVLQSARARIIRGWTQGAFARNREGIRQQATEPGGVCWCAVGAIEASTSCEILRESAVEALSRVVRSVGEGCRGRVYMWNDSPRRSRHQVIAAFDRAIARLS